MRVVAILDAPIAANAAWDSVTSGGTKRSKSVQAATQLPSCRDFWHFLGPLLRAVQNTKDSNGFAVDTLGNNVRSRVDDQDSGSLNPPWATHQREYLQAIHAGFNSVINRD
jgi:hypothetical protein